ncbi:MAG: response regulator [Caldilinea sp.]|nr:response regulator [Caldilinea sp.]
MASILDAERGQAAPQDQTIMLDAQRLAVIQDLAARNGEMRDHARMLQVLDSVLAPVLGQAVLALGTWYNGTRELLVASRTALEATALAEIRAHFDAEIARSNGHSTTLYSWQERCLPPREPEAAPAPAPAALAVLALPVDVSATAHTAVLIGTHAPLDKRDSAFLRTALIVANTASVRQGIDSLAANYAFQQTIEYATQNGIVVADLDGRVVYANQGFCRMVGRAQLEVIGQTAPYESWVAPAMHERLPHVAAQLSSAESTLDIDVTLLRATGQEFPAQLSITPMDQQGRRSGWLVNVTDTSRLRHAEMRYRQLFDEAPMMYVVTQIAEGGPLIADCNQTFLEMMDYTKAEVVGRRLTDFYHPESAMALRMGGYTSALNGLLQGEERILIRRDGKQIDTLLQARPEYDAAGNVTGTLAEFVDVSQLSNQNRRMLAANLISEVCLSAASTAEIFDIAPGILCEHLPFAAGLVHLGSVADDLELTLAGSHGIDVAGADTLLEQLHLLVHDVMQTESPFYASTPAELAETPLGALLSLLGAQAALVVPLAGVDGGVGTLTLLAADEEAITAPVVRMVLSIANVLSQAVHGIWVDEALAAERTSLERRVDERTAELQLLNHELERAARMKDEFLANMSHELRTPLSGILGMTEVMERGIYGALTERQQQALENIRESGQHLLALINDVLDLSKIGADRLNLEKHPVAIDDLCRASIRFVLQLATEKRQTITYTPSPAGLVLNVDARRLKQMLVNLLGNAVKFTPARGMIGIDVTYDAAHGTVEFAVWDNGIGISPRGQRRLFQPFVQIESGLDRRFEGSGLGLVLVKRLAELHGGDISLESAEGEGSRFAIMLPVEPIAGATAHTQAQPTADTGGDTEGVLNVLRQLGAARVVRAAWGEAMAQVEMAQPRLIVLDTPSMESAGWGLLQTLRALPSAQRPPVIVLAPAGDRQKAARAGATGFVGKPYSADDLVAEVTRAREASPAPDGTVLLVGGEQAACRILVAEDNDINFAIVGDYLAALGHSVQRARDGEEALARVVEQRPDLVLMDIQMHKVNGLEVIRRIRGLADRGLARTPIVALTALAMEGDRERCLAAGVDEYLAKPTDLDKLRVTVNRLAVPQNERRATEGETDAV